MPGAIHGERVDGELGVGEPLRHDVVPLQAEVVRKFVEVHEVDDGVLLSALLIPVDDLKDGDVADVGDAVEEGQLNFVERRKPRQGLLQVGDSQELNEGNTITLPDRI